MGIFTIAGSLWTQALTLMQEWGRDEIRRGGVPLLYARSVPFATARCAHW